MSEHAPRGHEHEHHPKTPEQSRESKENLEKLLEQAEKSPDTNHDTIEKLRESIEQEARSSKEEKIGKAHERHQTPTRIDKSVKKQAYQKSLREIQHKLPKQQRAFSKFIHQPTVEKISEVSGKTVARPSALLGGGVFALLGTGALVWMTRHYGYQYNYFMYVIFLVGGFLLGLLAEYAWRGLNKLRHK
jgi:flagellar biosynthesis GTPase FlhF